jgi:mono/diheme cytochrome c family protein
MERLPGVTKNLQGDPDLGGVPMRVTGVYLETLASALGAYPTSDLIDILCSDRYRSHFPKEYVAEHHPMLVWKVDGLTPKDWAAKTHHYNAGPYFVTYADFVPSFHVLSHADMPQMPTNIVRINFSTETMTFGPITPTGAHVGDAGVQAGFTIAKQNCLRCHYRGAVGGTKSGRDWTALSVWAREQPAYFSKYVLNPRSIEPHSHMAPNPGYSEATRMALVQYFRTFTETAGTKR